VSLRTVPQHNWLSIAFRGSTIGTRQLLGVRVWGYSPSLVVGANHLLGPLHGLGMGDAGSRTVASRAPTESPSKANIVWRSCSRRRPFIGLFYCPHNCGHVEGTSLV